MEAIQTGAMSSAPESLAIPSEGDGTVDSLWKRAPKKPIASIFVHAGAGYHSVVNEKVHLQACTE
jgi:taspase (threonine aspartase 1)